MLENKIRKFVLRKGLLPGSPFLFSDLLDWSYIVFILSYIVLRAIKIPITHDEAGTILNFSTQTCWDIITYKEPIPNNHILNTLLIKLFVKLGGYTELMCRLPNVIAGFFYLLFSVRISKLILKDIQVLRVAFLILLISNPYLMEFFSLARGYGLSVSLMMISIYYFIKSLDNFKFINYCLAFAILAVYSNLTLLNYFASLILGVLIFILPKSGSKKVVIFRMIVGIAILFILLSIPVLKMMQTNQFTYWGNEGFYKETFITLLTSAIQGKAYFTDKTFTIVSVLILLSFIFTIAKTIKTLYSRKYDSIAVVLNVLFIGCILYNVLQHVLLHIPYLNARTSLFFYPLFVLSISSSVAELRSEYFKVVLNVLYVLAALVGLVHIARSYNLHSSYEWWFDGDNKKVIQILDQASMLDKDIPVTFKCDWLFQPSMTFYIKGQNRAGISSPPYNKAIDTTALVDYYYITSDDMTDWFKNNYNVDTAFAWNSRYLMKKKP